jgi:hypothetical protein
MCVSVCWAAALAAVLAALFLLRMCGPACCPVSNTWGGDARGYGWLTHQLEVPGAAHSAVAALRGVRVGVQRCCGVLLACALCAV